MGVSDAQIREALERHFGFREFLEGQDVILRAVLDGYDVLVIMPTGGGKSLCYQLPALLLEGVTLVVSPLIALMKDQVDGLRARGIAATFINSSLSERETDERLAGLRHGEYRLVYVAPERFKSGRFLAALQPVRIGLFAVDEAHCISQWGHDFRPDYSRLKWALRALRRPQVVALTATATPEVREDIVAQLELGQHGRRAPRVFVTGFARRNLLLAVTRTANDFEKQRRAEELVRELRSGIVYCATRKHVERVSERLGDARLPTIAYHAGMTDDVRRRLQEQFMAGKAPVAVATNAFGMGIDRPDLRFVLHWDVPGSVEAYYQEAGRAGRDGEPARCDILFNFADVRTQEFFIEGRNPPPDLIADVAATLEDLCRRGPIEMPIKDIADLMPDRPNSMAVATALQLLDRAGFIARDYAPGSRVYTTRLAAPVKKFDDLEIDFEALEEKARRDWAKLKAMLAYVETPACRHGFILRYFGDSDAGAPGFERRLCQQCDNCRSKQPATRRSPMDEEWIIVQKALSCVARMKGRYGRGRVAQVLVGSRSKLVMDHRLNELSTYGLLKELGEEYVRALLDRLVEAGCCEIRGTDYPTVHLTEYGGRVMRRQESVELVWPRLPKASEETNQIARDDRLQPVEGRAPAGTDRLAAGVGSTHVGTNGPLPLPDPELLEALQRLRTRLALERNLPAYMVYHTSTLEEIARRRPRTEPELLACRGVGPAKVRAYGSETLQLVRAHSKGTR